MALAIIEEAEARGDIHPGSTIVEFTGGSTGTSLAFVCAVKGYHLKLVSSDAFAKEKRRTMQLFGADLAIVEAEEGKITPALFVSMNEKVQQMIREQGAYWTNQFNNRDALTGYRKMGAEILEQLSQPVDVFCAAVGTAGMLSGVSEEFRERSAQTKIVALEPASAPLLTKGVKGSHRVEGIGTGIVPPLLLPGSYDEARAVEEADARAMARLMPSREGIFAGTSTGVNVAAALELAKELGPGKTVVTVACDSGMKYLSGDLFAG